MTRISRGYIARRRRRKTSLGVSSSRANLSKLITQHEIKALASSDRDRDRQKRDFRCLWITRINSVIREGWVSYSYSRLIHDLYKRQLFLNRKILSQVAIANKNFIYLISNKILKSEVKWKESAGVIYGVTRRMNSGKVESK